MLLFLGWLVFLVKVFTHVWVSILQTFFWSVFSELGRSFKRDILLARLVPFTVQFNIKQKILNQNVACHQINTYTR